MDLDKRDQFLIAMYSELWGNINRSITVSWQAIAVLAGSVATLKLVGDGGMLADFTVALLAVVVTWQMCHVFDSNSWFSRNQGIISNIERQFLVKDDVKEILPYFAMAHRPPDRLLHHFRLHSLLGVGVMFIALLYHFVLRVVPGFGLSCKYFDPLRALPYIVTFICLFYGSNFRSELRANLNDFNDLSPGKELDFVNKFVD